MKHPPALETERLTLRSVTAGDADLYYRLWRDRDERVPAHRRLGADGRPTRDDLRAILARRCADGRDLLFTVVLRDTGEAVGYCGLTEAPGQGQHEPQLGYELLREVRGHGLGLEAACRAMAFVSDLGLHTLRADVWEWNAPSRRILRALGFIETGEYAASSDHGRSVVTRWISEAHPTYVTLRGSLLCSNEEQQETVRAYLPEHIARTRDEPGCVAFEVYETGRPGEWGVAEAFVDERAFDCHQKRVATSEWGRVTTGIERRYVISRADPRRNNDGARSPK